MVIRSTAAPRSDLESRKLWDRVRLGNPHLLGGWYDPI
jgi:hypothetical protein